MKKRALSLLLAIALLCTLLPIGTAGVKAYSETDIAYPVEGGNIYFDKATGTITDCDDTVTSADIPAEIDGVAVTVIGNGAFYYCSSLTSVTISDSVTIIGAIAFHCCSSLTSVTIPDSVTSIGDWAFEGCSSLTSVTIPDSVTSIGYGAFFGCSSLTSVTIPDSVTTISSGTFNQCTSLTSVTIPDSVTSIGGHAFYSCSSLTSITIPDSVTSIGDSAFSYCNSLTGIWVDEANPNYSSDASGVLFNKDKTELIQCGGAYSGDYTTPDSVTSIGFCAFFGCSSLTSVTISNNVTSIGFCAFEGCTSLASVTIPDSVTSIGYDAFCGTEYYNDENNWENNVLYIGKHLIEADDIISGEYAIKDATLTIAEQAFYDCRSLTSVTIPDSVTSISFATFGDCTSLTSVTIPDSVTSIGDCAFSYCGSLSDVYFGGTEGEWNVITIGDDNDALLNATIHYTNDEPSEEPSEPSEEPSEPNEEPTDPSEEPSEPSEEPTEPSEEPSEPSEEPTEPSEEPTEPSEEPTEPSEEPTEPSEEPDEPEIPTENPFTDVKASDYFATPVLWAVGKNITNGMSATSFAPNANCTRGQIVTFLWRACGSPEPTSTKNNFKDVKAGEYYYKAVLWAVENGITTGLSATSFGPNATCTRGQVATFLWRSQGEPAPTSTNNPFSDVKTSDYYFNAVLWAVENNVTQGMGGGKFAPNASCTRGQIVTFLYRAIA